MSDNSNGSGTRFLVTGAYGCIGAWAIRELLDEKAYVVAFDLSDDVHRLKLLLSEEELSALPRVAGDITSLEALEQVLDEHRITNVIHLAALQVPFCRANPPLGAHVNVVGTVNVLEAVARRRTRIGPLVYASSIAAYEDLRTENGRKPSPDGGTPGTLYGVYKRANEGAAALYWQDFGVASIGLRPHTVYGPGRDQGATSAPTAAMLAAAAGHPFHIGYGGWTQMQYAADVARSFIAASRTRVRGSSVHDLPGHRLHMREIVAAIEQVAPASVGSITYDDSSLPFPDDVDAASFDRLVGAPRETPFLEGVAETIDRFTRLLEAGLISDPAVN